MQRLLEVEIVGVLDTLQPGRQPHQIEPKRVALPLVRTLVLRIHAGQRLEVGLTLIPDMASVRVAWRPTDRPSTERRRDVACASPPESSRRPAAGGAWPSADLLNTSGWEPENVGGGADGTSAGEERQANRRGGSAVGGRRVSGRNGRALRARVRLRETCGAVQGVDVECLRALLRERSLVFVEWCTDGSCSLPA